MIPIYCPFISVAVCSRDSVGSRLARVRCFFHPIGQTGVHSQMRGPCMYRHPCHPYRSTFLQRTRSSRDIRCGNTFQRAVPMLSSACVPRNAAGCCDALHFALKPITAPWTMAFDLSQPFGHPDRRRALLAQSYCISLSGDARRCRSVDVRCSTAILIVSWSKKALVGGARV